MKKKKISRETLKDILHDEQVEENWNSIRNSETIRKAEADEKFWKEHLDPYYDEMFPHTPAKAVSDEVRKQMETYEEENAVWYREMDVIESMGILTIGSMGLLWGVMGIFLLIWIMYVAMFPEDSCLSC